VAERVAAEEALAAVDRYRLLQLDAGGLQPPSQVVKVIGKESRMTGRAVLAEVAVRREEDVELVLAAAVPGAPAPSVRERLWSWHRLEAEKVLEEATGFDGPPFGHVYLDVVEAEDGHGGIIQAGQAEQTLRVS